MAKKDKRWNEMNKNKYLSLQRLITICERLEEPRRESGNYQHDLTDIFVIVLDSVYTNYATTYSQSIMQASVTAPMKPDVVLA